MNIPLLNRLFDERFFEHRRRSTSVAGIAAAETALLISFYQFFVNHVVRWDLLSIVAVFLVVKIALMTWYYLTA